MTRTPPAKLARMASCERDTIDVSVVCSAEPPYNVVAASQGWLDLCGFTLDEIAGSDLKIIQGVATDHAALRKVMDSFSQGICPSSPIGLINYDKRGRPFRHTVSIEPLKDEATGATTHYVARSTDISSLHHAQRVPVLELLEPELDDEEDTKLALNACAHLAGAPVLGPSPWDGCQLHWLSCGAPHEVVTHASHPYSVVWASPDWLATCGFQLEDIVGRGLRMIQGAATDQEAVAALMQAARHHLVARNLKLINYDKNRKPFSHVLTMTPVEAEGDVEYLRATSVCVERLSGKPAPELSSDNLPARLDVDPSVNEMVTSLWRGPSRLVL